MKNPGKNKGDRPPYACPPVTRNEKPNMSEEKF